jgi:hypothetical protein
MGDFFSSGVGLDTNKFGDACLASWNQRVKKLQADPYGCARTQT